MGRLVARRHDLDTAQRALSESRLLTFTGPGGVGKTRLALELAFRSGSRFPDGAWLVRLADLSIGAGVQEVESAVVDALGVSDQSATAPREKLLTFLGNRKLLVVLSPVEVARPRGVAPGSSTRRRWAWCEAELRVAEIVSLKACIDSKRMLIRVEEGKAARTST